MDSKQDNSGWSEPVPTAVLVLVDVGRPERVWHSLCSGTGVFCAPITYGLNSLIPNP